MIEIQYCQATYCMQLITNSMQLITTKTDSLILSSGAISTTSSSLSRSLKATARVPLSGLAVAGMLFTVLSLRGGLCKSSCSLTLSKRTWLLNVGNLNHVLKSCLACLFHCKNNMTQTCKIHEMPGLAACKQIVTVTVAVQDCQKREHRQNLS